ncbi:MAG: GatB/YqeY domain-containing protein [Candidatus Parcubacteria bacterium]|nr:GatB/YqeY domain-containing protein [Candidatus Parcubacteria bacterium]
MSILQQIEIDFQQALKDQNQNAKSTLRLILAALKYERIKKMADLTDDDVIKIIKSEIKKRKESIVEYEKGKRQDLADKEQEEINIIAKYMPAQLSEDDVRTKVKAILESIEDRDNAGRVMGKVMAEMKGQADGTLVRKFVEEELEK